MTVKDITVPLLSLESSRLLLEEDGIASITFYRGDLQKVKERMRLLLRQVVTANPWLSGRLVRNKKQKNVQLTYSQEPITDSGIEQLFHSESSLPTIGSEMDYESLYNASRSAVIEKGIKLINKDKILTKISIVPDIHVKNGFALIFSISHIAADGYTYYRIFNSLFSHEPPPVMKVTRNHQAGEAVANAVGRKEYDYLFSAPFIINAIKGAIFGKKAKCYAYYVDLKKISEQKKSVAIGKSDTNYVSTNDLLTAGFTKTIESRLCMSAINVRNRVEGIDESNAGNYEAALLFDDKKSTTATSVRKTLEEGPPYSPTEKKLPGLLEGISCRLGMITNWAGFTGDLTLDACDQTLHMPLHGIKMMPLDCAIIFAPLPGKLAILFFAKSVSELTLVAGCPLAEKVSEKIF